MAAKGRIAAMALVTATLSGCLYQQLPPPETVTLAPVPGEPLPFKARVMIYAGEQDLTRTLVIQANRTQTDETPVKDGLLMTKAAKTPWFESTYGL